MNLSESDGLINRIKSRFWFLFLFVQIVPEILPFDLKAFTISAALHLVHIDWQNHQDSVYLEFRIKAAGAFLAAVEDAMQAQSGFTLKQKQLAIQIKLQSLIALFPKKLS